MDATKLTAKDLGEVNKIIAHTQKGPPRQKHVTQLRGYTVKSLITLIKTMEKLQRQNQDLELRNIQLQGKMLYLTYVMGIVAIMTFISEILIPALGFFQTR